MNETKIELIGLNYKLLCLETRTFQLKNLIPSVKHGGGVSWLGHVLLHLGQDSLPSLMEQ